MATKTNRLKSTSTHQQTHYLKTIKRRRALQERYERVIDRLIELDDNFYALAEDAFSMVSQSINSHGDVPIDIAAFDTTFKKMIKLGTLEDWKEIIWGKPGSRFVQIYEEGSHERDFFLDFVEGSKKHLKILPESVRIEFLKEQETQGN